MKQPFPHIQEKIAAARDNLMKAIVTKLPKKKLLAAVERYAKAKAELACEIKRIEDFTCSADIRSEVSMWRKRANDRDAEVAWWKGTRRREHWVASPNEENALYSLMPRTLETAKSLKEEGETVYHVITTVRKADLK